MKDDIRNIVKIASEFKRNKEIDDLKKRVKKLEEKNRPKTLIERKREKEKNWLYED